MLYPKELLLLNYFATNHRPITIAEILIKFKKEGDKDCLLNLLCTLEEMGLVVEDPQTHAWRISSYGKITKGSTFERLVRA